MSDNQPPGTRFWPRVTFENRRVLQTQLRVKAKLWGQLKAKRLLSSCPPQWCINWTDWVWTWTWLIIKLFPSSFDLLGGSNWFWFQYLFSFFFLDSVSSTGTSFHHLWFLSPDVFCIGSIILYSHLALFPTWAPLSVRNKFGMHVLCPSVVCIWHLQYTCLYLLLFFPSDMGV